MRRIREKSSQAIFHVANSEASIQKPLSHCLVCFTVNVLLCVSTCTGNQDATSTAEGEKQVNNAKYRHTCRRTGPFTRLSRLPIEKSSLLVLECRTTNHLLKPNKESAMEEWFLITHLLTIIVLTRANISLVRAF